jgi:hypothetical protein
MCDDCKELEEVEEMLDLPDDDPDSIEKAKLRLRCYYRCVTRAPDIFEFDEDDT